MRILIKRLRKSRQNMENVMAQFKSGKEAKLLNFLSFDIKSLLGNEIECLLLVNLFSAIDSKAYDIETVHPIMEGTYLGEYNSLQKWKIGKRYELIPGCDDFTYHAIKTDDGTFLIRVKTNLEKRNVKVGEAFKFKVIDFELMAWEPIEGEREIDPLAFEKSVIDNFWDIIERTHDASNFDAQKQLKLIKKELFDCSFDEIWLFEDIIVHLSLALRLNLPIYKDKWDTSVNYFTYFFNGIVCLGKNTYRRALLEPKKFIQDILPKKYVETPQNLELDTDYLLSDIIKKKSGKTPHYASQFLIRQDIGEVRDRIYLLLNEEFEINWG